MGKFELAALGATAYYSSSTPFPFLMASGSDASIAVLRPAGRAFHW